MLLRLLAAAAAGGAQAIVFTRPDLGVAGFAVGMLLFLVAERRTPPPLNLDARQLPPVATGFWTLLAVGCAFGAAAGILVYRQGHPPLTHPVWLLGLLSFVACAVWTWWRNRSGTRPARKHVAAIILLLALAGGSFGWRLASIPPEVHGDEGEEGMDAVELLKDKPLNLFTVGWYWLPRLHVLRQAVGMKVFGVNLLGLRSSSAVLGAIGVVVVFVVGAQLWGFEVGLLAGLVLVSARFFIHLSRTGLEYLDTPVLSIVVVWLAWWVWRDLRLDAAILCGIALGLGVQSYYASRLVPVLLTLTWGAWLARTDPERRRARLIAFGLIAVVALATAAPMIGYFWRRPADLWMRTLETSAFSQSGINHLSYGYGRRDMGYILLIQLQHAVALFNYQSDSSLQYGGFRPGGLFEPVCAALFTLGFASVCARPLQRRNLLLLLWIAIPVIVGGALTIDTPFYPRIAGVVPFAALVVALALHSILASVRETLPRAGRWIAGIVAVGVVAVVFATNVRDYFFIYAPAHRHGPGLEISAWVRANGAGKTTYMVGGKGFYIRHGTIRFLTYGYQIEDVVDLDAYLHATRFTPATSLFIIMPQGQELIPQLTAAVGPLDIQPHSFRGNDVAFFTAVPIAPATGPRPPAS